MKTGNVSFGSMYAIPMRQLSKNGKTVSEVVDYTQKYRNKDGVNAYAPLNKIYYVNIKDEKDSAFEKCMAKNAIDCYPVSNAAIEGAVVVSTQKHKLEYHNLHEAMCGRTM